MIQHANDTIHKVTIIKKRSLSGDCVGELFCFRRKKSLQQVEIVLS